MENLKIETLRILKEINKNVNDIDYCHVYETGFDDDCQEFKKSILKGKFNIDKLDFEYDSGFGAQIIFGFIVFKDDSWLERAEYDGAEAWSYKYKPIDFFNKGVN